MKKNTFTFRISDSDLQILLKMSEINCKTPSEYIRTLFTMDYDNYIYFGDFLEKQNEEIKCMNYDILKKGKTEKR